MTFQYHTAKKLARLVRAMDKDIKLILGGYHATLAVPEQEAEGDDNLFDFSGEDGRLFDFIVRGEGEATFRELVDALDGEVKALILSSDCPTRPTANGTITPGGPCWT